MQLNVLNMSTYRLYDKSVVFINLAELKSMCFRLLAHFFDTTLLK